MMLIDDVDSLDQYFLFVNQLTVVIQRYVYFLVYYSCLNNFVLIIL